MKSCGWALRSPRKGGASSVPCPYGENLDLGAFTSKDRGRSAKIRKWIFDLFPRLAEREGQLAGTLSGGEQQMLAMGRALMSIPSC